MRYSDRLYTVIHHLNIYYVAYIIYTALYDICVPSYVTGSRINNILCVLVYDYIDLTPIDGYTIRNVIYKLYTWSLECTRTLTMTYFEIPSYNL